LDVDVEHRDVVLASGSLAGSGQLATVVASADGQDLHFLADDGPSGPDRTILKITPSGARALANWLAAPVEHVRDARSLLLLKLLFLSRREHDPNPLLHAQRAQFETIAERLAVAVAEARGFDHTLLRWRLESASAAVRFMHVLIGLERLRLSRGGAAQSAENPPGSISVTLIHPTCNTTFSLPHEQESARPIAYREPWSVPPIRIARPRGH
jgi:hypothetical protein